MTIQPLGVEVRPGRLCVSGDLDVVSAPQLLDAILCFALTDDQKKVAVDLSAVRFLDSTGLSALIVARNTLDERGRVLTVENPSREAALTINITGVAEVLGVTTTAPLA